MWLLFLHSDLETTFSNINIPFDCEFLIAQETEHDIMLLEIYRASASVELKVEKFGVWNSISGLTAPTGSLSLRRTDLQGITIRAAVLDGKTEYFIPPDGHYGMLENEKWNGLIGMIVRNETDVSITPLIWNKQRNEVVNFIASMFKISVFLQPFSFMLWISIFATITGSALVLFIIDKVWNQHLIKISWFHILSSLSELFLTTFGAFCYQAGHYKTPTNTSGRVVFVSIYLTSVVILCCYSGSLISYIATHYYTLPFNDLEEFLKDGTYKMGVLKSSGDLTYFKDSNNPMIREVYRSFISPHVPNSLFSSYIEGLERVCSQFKYASVFGNDKFTPLSNLECNLHYLPIVQYDMSMTMSKNCPYKQVIGYV
ncbi:hypothetical protein L9F63_022469 [Diploptera punctata]|uniref:Uncharacterized protein n=1 Tax=Diploptera punctata TaxID=6984 RepID=A0AAD8EAI9_DIPPU|nr:hypothetical protein L9F63_022469 [Diploptera punctata]